MANITFSSPDYKDKTVYAVAGSHTETILKIAKTNQIPLKFDCGDGECGSCLVQITHLGKDTPKGMHLTDKEREVLMQNGKLSKAELDELIVNDLPSKWRLACQMIVRDEDIVVEY